MHDHLMERDGRLMVESLLSIHTAETIDDVIDETLQLLGYIVPADQHTFNKVERVEGKGLRVVDMIVRGEPALYKDQFVDSEYNFDPYFYGFEFFKETVVFRDTDILPDEYRMNTKLYQEIYVPQNIHYALRSHLVYNKKIVGNISIFNSKKRGDFSERDVYATKLVAPHVAYKLWTLQKEESEEHVEQNPDVDLTKFSLTPREEEIALKLYEGVPDDVLAETLFISPATLKKHIYNIYRKLDVNNRVQLYQKIAGSNPQKK